MGGTNEQLRVGTVCKQSQALGLLGSCPRVGKIESQVAAPRGYGVAEWSLCTSSGVPVLGRIIPPCPESWVYPH